jgi:quaternary ammonium compound-resistance protein SugE
VDPVAWFYLVVAGLMEIVWAVALKQSEGLTRIGPTLVAAFFFVVSLVLLTLALRHLPLGTGYAVWTGIGILGTAVFGIAVLGEPAGLVRIGSMLLILAGIAGLKFTSP